ncbi:GNAT family N-acetyltransferase [Asticcacaulis sp. AND118]|uniref:GNAT family N-acetyltransferase n=1 Tax=Asticcacaulis sp. AND118 TaxID=2840468 RepID=UPI001CFFBEB2|nr:GNAT family N-acetyltransferase [Asticcacaulis sp. AND118]UDF03451.1 N-acetyltransferase [Asticcacaulis sp. AND118]
MSDIIDNTAQSRFELTRDGYVAYADYHLQGEVLNIDYVFAPPELRGSGAAGELMKGIVAAARTRGQKIHPICGYAAAWLKRSSESYDLLI